MGTKIEWAQDTCNIFVGCSKVSTGCKNCYAERMATRLKRFKKYGAVIDGHRWNGHTYFDRDEIKKFYVNGKPKIIFMSSMGDIFHETINYSELEFVWDLMYDTKNIYIILTKRPEKVYEFQEYMLNKGRNIWFENIWLGFTAENQKYFDIRVSWFQYFNARVRFISVEPILGEIDISRYSNIIDWVICGGETGYWSRRVNPDDVVKLLRQCQEFNVPFFFKNWGYYRYIPRAMTADGNMSYHLCKVERNVKPYQNNEIFGTKYHQYPKAVKLLKKYIR